MYADVAETVHDTMRTSPPGGGKKWKMVLPRNIRNMSAMKKMTPMDHCQPNNCRSPYHPYGRQGEYGCHGVG